MIINSIEAFERTKVSARKISIVLETDEDFTIHYNDNGCGLGDKFKNPYDIFKFGATSKHDKDGEQIGTGLGMYIVASTAREYNAQYVITEINSGFGLDIKFPLWLGEKIMTDFRIGIVDDDSGKVTQIMTRLIQGIEGAAPEKGKSTHSTSLILLKSK